MGNCINFKDGITTELNRKKKSKKRNGSRRIGRGTVSDVYLVEKIDTGNFYAMKVIKKTREYKKDAKDIKGERMILEKLRHPFLITLHYAFQRGFTCFLVQELAEGGDLLQIIHNSKGFTEEECKFYAAEIICGIEFLHKNKIIYRGLKPEDVLLTKEGHIKLSDFGLSREADEITSTFCGSPLYLAPEIIKEDSQTFAVDWWSLGILIYEMMFCITPFHSSSPKVVLKAILSRKVSFPKQISKELKDLIINLLNPNPKERLGCENDAVDIKSHAFFSDINWSKVDCKELIPPCIPSIKMDSGFIKSHDKEFIP